MASSDDEDYYLDPYETTADEAYRVIFDHQNKKKFFTILTEEDLLSRIEDGVLELSSLISNSRETARNLLCRSNWNLDSIHADWLADQETFANAFARLMKKPEPIDIQENNFVCRICSGEYSFDVAVVTSPVCRHVFCKTCWKNYINKSINQGLMLTCPEYSCGVTVGRSVINSLASDEDKRRYDNYLVRSYVESRKDMKLCPTPGCGCAVEYCIEGRGSRNFDVTCNCFYGFCWNCLEEAHSPVDCETVAKWTAKNSSDLETKNWLLAKTKPCPQCQRPIENIGNNYGYLNMLCAPPCNFDFCWLCSGALSEHDHDSGADGGLSVCNIYKEGEKEGVHDEEKRKRERAKDLWGYYERWYNNHYSRERAFLDLLLVKNVDLVELSEILSFDEIHLWFIVDAWMQMIECRRVLKWACVYGYYLPQNEHTKKELLEYMLSQAEAVFERLHQYADKEFVKYLQAERPSDEFNDFRSNLARLTRVTRKYFDNLVTALKNDLSDVDSQATTSSKKIEATTSSEKIKPE